MKILRTFSLFFECLASSGRAQRRLLDAVGQRPSQATLKAPLNKQGMETDFNYVGGPAADAAGNGFTINFGWFTFSGCAGGGWRCALATSHLCGRLVTFCGTDVAFAPATIASSSGLIFMPKSSGNHQIHLRRH